MTLRRKNRFQQRNRPQESEKARDPSGRVSQNEQKKAFGLTCSVRISQDLEEAICTRAQESSNSKYLWEISDAV